MEPPLVHAVQRQYLDTSSVINCDGLHTSGQRRLTKRLGSVDDDTLDEVCSALAIALGCEGG